MLKSAMVCDDNKERKKKLTDILRSLSFRVMPCVTQLESTQALEMDPDIAIIHWETGKAMNESDLAALRRAKTQNGTLFFLMGAEATEEKALKNAANLGVEFDGFLPETFTKATIRQKLKASYAL